MKIVLTRELAANEKFDEKLMKADLQRLLAQEDGRFVATYGQAGSTVLIEVTYTLDEAKEDLDLAKQLRTRMTTLQYLQVQEITLQNTKPAIRQLDENSYELDPAFLAYIALPSSENFRKRLLKEKAVDVSIETQITVIPGKQIRATFTSTVNTNPSAQFTDPYIYCTAAFDSIPETRDLFIDFPHSHRCIMTITKNGWVDFEVFDPQGERSFKLGNAVPQAKRREAPQAAAAAIPTGIITITLNKVSQNLAPNLINKSIYALLEPLGFSGNMEAKIGNNVIITLTLKDPREQADLISKIPAAASRLDSLTLVSINGMSPEMLAAQAAKNLKQEGSQQQAAQAAANANSPALGGAAAAQGVNRHRVLAQRHRAAQAAANANPPMPGGAAAGNQPDMRRLNQMFGAAPEAEANAAGAVAASNNPPAPGGGAAAPGNGR